MKERILAVLVTLMIFLLTACQAPVAEESPSNSVEPLDSAEPALSLINFPDFVILFAFSRVDRLVTGGYEMSWDICQLDESQRLTLKGLLAMDSWSEADDVPAIGLEPDYTLFNDDGDSLAVTDWGEDVCLIVAKTGADSYLYYAPLSVLDVFNDFMSGLTFLPDADASQSSPSEPDRVGADGNNSTAPKVTPSGTVENTAAPEATPTDTALRYYNLFRADRGIAPLVELATADGSISDQQINAYVTERLPDYDFGSLQYTTAAHDTIASRHFGRTVANPEYYAQSYDGGIFMVLQGRPAETDGVITAQFKCYFISDTYWDRTNQDEPSHIQEYLLAGNDEGFPEPKLVQISFEEKLDADTHSSYVFYHSVKVLS